MAVPSLRSFALIPLRVIVFAVGFVDYHFESAADWLIGARAATEYVRQGSCRRCGTCCQLLGIEMPRWVARRRWLVRFLRAWHSAGLNFEYLGETDTMLGYSCRYYRPGPAGGGCSIHPFRHRLCRFFPRQRLYGRPSLHDECGYSFVRRSVLKERDERAREGRPVFDRIIKG